MSHVPLVDLGWQHAQIAPEVERGFARILDESCFVLGKEVLEFEERFSLDFDNRKSQFILTS